jgi:hypothetical protein
LFQAFSRNSGNQVFSTRANSGFAEQALTGDAAMTPTKATHEIRKLEQELENLEHAYATTEQGALWAKRAFVVFIAALIALILGGVVINNGELVFMSLAVLIMCALVLLSERGNRWIDYVSGDDAKALENMIAARRARLTVLHRERSGDAGELGVGTVAGLIPPPPSSTGTLGRSGYGGLLHRIGNDPLLIITTIIVVLVGFLLVQKYNDCMERGGKACPLNCDKFGKNCRLPYGAPEPLSKEPPAGPIRSSGAGL